MKYIDIQVFRMYDIKKLTSKDAVIVNTEQESLALRQLMHNVGMKWYNGVSYLDTILNLNPVAFVTAIGGYLSNRSSLKEYNNIQIYQIKGIEKYLKMEEKQLIGYKIKEEFIETLKSLFNIHSWNKDLTTHFAENSDVYNRIVELKTLDSWCIPVYRKEIALPVINGYEGSIKTDTKEIVYGCAYLPFHWFQGSHNRMIHSMTLSSGVEINGKNVHDIREYLIKNNLI